MSFAEVSPAGGGRPDVHPFVRELARSFVVELPAFVAELEERVVVGSPVLGALGDDAGDGVRAVLEEQVGQVVRGIAGLEVLDFEPTGEMARLCAVAGIPLAALLDVHRMAAEVAWEHFVRFGRELAGNAFTAGEVLDGASRLWTLTNRFSAVISEAYHETAADLARVRERERGVLLDVLFDGRAHESISAGDAAQRLGVPDRSTFVAVVAPDPAADQVVEGLGPELLRAGVSSVWRAVSGRLTGIVVVNPGDNCGRDGSGWPLDQSLDRWLPGPFGVSPPFSTALVDTPANVALADVACRCAPPGASGPVHYDRVRIAALVVRAPGPAHSLAGRVLGPVLALPDSERASVLETLAAWMDSRGSASELAERLYCHRNTARNRLGRAEELVGGSLSDPRVAAEVLVAMTAWRLDPDGLR